MARTPQARDAREPPVPPDGPESRSRHLAVLLATTRNYREFLRTLGVVFDDLIRAAPAPVEEDGPCVRPRPDPAALAETLLGALESATDPMVRQHLIFHVAMALPPETAFPVLRSLRPLGGGDSEDALCALAFRGDPAALREFVALAVQPAPVDARRLVDVLDHDRLAEAGERELLRAWRCIEALQGGPYFSLHSRVFLHDELEGPPPGGEALAAEVLPAWLARYDGHPGSDDMALWLARIAWKAGDVRGTLLWASRATTLPDTDARRSAAALLAAAAELAPLEDVLALGPDPADPERNRGLLLYVRLRRLAAERGFAVALDEAALLAAREPWLPISQAFRARDAEPPPLGLESGLHALAVDDPLLATTGTRLPDDPLLPSVDRSAEARGIPEENDDPFGEERLRRECLVPPMDPVRLPPRRLAFQFRCWETIAALERRRAAAPTVGARSEILYKEAAVLFHNRDSLYPLHSPWQVHGTGRPWPIAATPETEPREGPSEEDLAWCRRNLPRLRAAALFQELLDGDPASPLADRAGYSLGLACVMAAREPPLLDGRHLAVELQEPRRLLERCVDAFDRCAREHPDSPLAPDAAALAGRWRRRIAKPGE